MHRSLNNGSCIVIYSRIAKNLYTAGGCMIHGNKTDNNTNMAQCDSKIPEAMIYSDQYMCCVFQSDMIRCFQRFRATQQELASYSIPLKLK